MSSFWAKPKALLEICTGCNANCIFCRRNELRSGMGKRARVDMRRLEGFVSFANKLKLDRIEIGGDEPTVLPLRTLAAIALRCRSAGFSRVVLISNGIKLANREWVRVLVKSGINIFVLPLYGSTREIHDSVTQYPGSFDALKKAIKNLRTCDAKIFLHSLVLRQNEKDLKSILSLAHRWGLPLKRHSLVMRDKHVDYSALQPNSTKAFSISAPKSTVRLRYKVFSFRSNDGMQGGFRGE